MKSNTLQMKTIDLTPTWLGLLPALVHVSVNGTTAKGRTIADEELRRMAQIADGAVQAEKRSYSLCEAVADLAAMFADEKYAPNTPDDSRETVRLCIEWAQAFEAKHADADTKWGEDDNGEYMEEIEKWFVAMYGEWDRSSAAKGPR